MRIEGACVVLGTIVAGIALGFRNPPAPEGTSPVRSAGEAALKLEHEGRYTEAASLYQSAAPEIRQRFGTNSFEYARWLIQEGLLELQMGRYAQSAAHTREALIIEESSPGASAYDRAVAANDLGFALLKMGQPGAAKKLLDRAVREWEAQPEAREQLASSLNNRGALEQQYGSLAAARTDEERAWKLATQVPPVGELTRAGVLTNLARVEMAERNRREARRLLDEACALTETQPGLGQVRYAAALSNLAALESGQKHFRQAEALYRKALALDQEILGHEHLEVGVDLSNIATQLVREKRAPMAVPLYERARAIEEKNNGPVSSGLAHTWRNLAIAYYDSKQFNDSAEAYRKAIETNPDNDVSGWLREYANALRKAQRFGEAEQAETRALGIDVKNTLAVEKRSGKL